MCVSPSRIVVNLKIWFNAWPTSARLGLPLRRCPLCSQPCCFDNMDHYYCCDTLITLWKHHWGHLVSGPFDIRSYLVLDESQPVDVLVALAFHWSGAAYVCKRGQESRLDLVGYHDSYVARIRQVAYGCPLYGVSVARRMHV